MLRLEALRTDPIAFSSSYEEEVQFSEEEWKRRIANALFAVDDDDKPIGMLACVFEKKSKTKHIANIFGLYVSPEYRGKGVGKKLLSAALSRISENKDIVKVNLNVNPKQRAAVALYQKLGFVVVGKLEKDIQVDGVFYDELVMEKFM